MQDSKHRTVHDAGATQHLRLTEGGHFLVVTVMSYHTRVSHDRGIKIADPGFFYFTPMRVLKFEGLFCKSLYQGVAKNHTTHSYFLMNSIREKATLTCQLSSRQHLE